MVEHHPHGNFVFVPYMTTSASTNKYMGCKIWRSVIARISDKTIRTRATICQGRSMFLLPVRRVDRCSEYQMHRFINHCFFSLRCHRLLDAASRTDLISGESPNRRTTLGRVLHASTCLFSF